MNIPVKDKSRDKSGRWARANFMIVLSYHGGSFDGWQKQPDLNTVQGYVFYNIAIHIMNEVNICPMSFHVEISWS